MQTLEQLSPEAIQHSFSHVLKTESAYSRALIPLLKALDWQEEFHHIVEALPHKADSLDLSGLLHTMEQLHFYYERIEIALKDIDQRLFPCLFIGEFGEVLLVRGDAAHYPEIYDASGNKNTSPSHYGELQGVCYLFKKAEKPKEVTPNLNWFRSAINQYRSVFGAMLLISLFINLFMLATPLFIMATYDRFITTGYYSMMANFFLGAIIALAGCSVLQKIRAKVLSYVSSRLDFVIGNEIIKHIIYLPVGYTESASISSQINRIKDFDNTREAISGIFFTLFFDLPFIIIFIIAIALISNIYLAMLPVSLLLLLYFSALFFKKRLKHSSENMPSIYYRYQNFLLESFNQLFALKALGAGSTWKKRQREMLAEHVNLNYRTEMIYELIQYFSNQYITFAGLVVLIASVISVFNQNLSVGGMIAVMILAWRIVGPYKSFLMTLVKLPQITNSIKQINFLMHLPPEQSLDTFPNNTRGMGNTIIFQNVSMRYQKNLNPAINNLSFKIESGQILGITGRNGAGKSTILKILLGLYPVEMGAIFINTINLRQFNVNQLREYSGYVPQKLRFFYGTIQQNMLLAKSDATDEEIAEALKLADVYQAVMALPHGLDTLMPDNCESLFNISLLQSLAIARALLKKPKILLLDESFAGFDRNQDLAFIHMLQKLRGETTIILVSERPSHLKITDKLLVMEAGRALAFGPTSEILPKLMQGTKQ